MEPVSVCIAVVFEAGTSRKIISQTFEAEGLSGWSKEKGRERAFVVDVPAGRVDAVLQNLQNKGGIVKGAQALFQTV